MGTSRLYPAAPIGAPMTLKRQLGLRDVYAISTGAMFSSGFFLLPGLAFSISGSWMVLAYLCSAIIVLPAMFSKAELASSLSKSGGTYYFLDRSMGPLVGTVGGLGTWVAMGLKNTFALVGCGAYAAIFFDIDMTLVAVVCAVGFVAINIVGAKETAALQRWLVYALVGILALFVMSGLAAVGGEGVIERTRITFSSASGASLDSFATTIALVFVSYAGLTKVVGVVEEIERPDRDVLRGMALSLLTGATIYGVGTYLVVMLCNHETLGTDLTPIASAAGEVFGWLPGRTGVALVFLAAVAAFASTANAGILSASRYLLAMGRDRLISERFAGVGRFRTPTFAVLVTGGFIVLALLTLDVVSIAKLASAFQLLMFALVSAAVIVMRESKIESYAPKVKSPLYPWLQIAGVFLPAALILQLGALSVIFTLVIVAGSVAWYFAYAKDRVQRRGAIRHVFERLGRERDDTLKHEIWSIMKESGLSDPDPYLAVIERAQFVDLEGADTFENIATSAAALLAERIDLEPDAIAARFRQGVHAGLVPITDRLALPHFRTAATKHAEMVVVRARRGIQVTTTNESAPDEVESITVRTLFFLISPEHDPGEHLRILARLAKQVDAPDFSDRWAALKGPEQLRTMLLNQVVTDVADQLTHGGSGPLEDRFVAKPTSGAFQNALCVVQSGAASASTLRLIQHVAETHSVRITVAKVLPDFGPAQAETLEATKSFLETNLVQPVRRLGVDCDVKVLTGRPWVRAIQEAAEGGHDLVLASAAPGEGDGFDSFTRHLLRKCPMPVWVERADRFQGCSRVLAAINAGDETERHGSLNEKILRVAQMIAARANAELHVVQAWSLLGEELFVSRGAPKDEVSYAKNQERARISEGLHSIIDSLDLTPHEIHFVEGDPSEVVPSIAASQSIDLVVMGTVGRSGLAGRFIGTTAEDVLRRLRCGVVAVKPTGFRSPVRKL